MRSTTRAGRFFPEGEELKEHEARFAQYPQRRQRVLLGDEDSAHPRPAVRRLRSRRRPRRSRSSAPRSPVPTGVTTTRSASDSSSRSTARGSRWSACRATWCITGSCAQFETVYRPLSQTAPYSVAFAVRTVGDPNALAGDLRRAVSKVDRRSADCIAGGARHAGRGAGGRICLHRPRARRGRR